MLAGLHGLAGICIGHIDPAHDLGHGIDALVIAYSLHGGNLEVLVFLAGTHQNKTSLQLGCLLKHIPNANANSNVKNLLIALRLLI